jgi:G3E family GTPase
MNRRTTIPVNIVTGFLGAGKTTLVRELLRKGYAGISPAIIVNDYGEVGIDGAILSQSSATVVELAGGCMCCSEGISIEESLNAVVEQCNPDRVIFETSGLSYPAPIIHELQAMGMLIDSIITVVDAATFGAMYSLPTVVRSQLSVADFIVITKTGKVNPLVREEFLSSLRRINDRALMILADSQQDAYALFCGTGIERDGRTVPLTITGMHSSDHAVGLRPRISPHDGIESFVLQSERKISRSQFESFVNMLPKDLYRSKGIVCFAGGYDPFLFNFVRGRYSMDEPIRTLESNAIPTSIVFIGRDISRFKEQWRTAFAQCEIHYS